MVGQYLIVCKYKSGIKQWEYKMAKYKKGSRLNGVIDVVARIERNKHFYRKTGGSKEIVFIPAGFLQNWSVSTIRRQLMVNEFYEAIEKTQ